MRVEGDAHRAPRAREEPEDHADRRAEARGRHQGERRRAKRGASSATREGRSELLLEKTQARLEDIQREIDGLRLKRRDVETSIEATIQTLRNTLEFVREQEARERDDKILLHRPRIVESPVESRELHEARNERGVTSLVRVIPRARKTECAGVRDGALVISVAAPPVEGAANDALIEFLSATLHVPRRAIRILSGEHGRQKRVAVDGMTAADIEARLSYN